MQKIAHPILKQLGATIRSLRLQQKMSQETLADRAAIDRSYMSGIERGLRNISMLHAARIAAALDVTLSDLLRFDLDIAELVVPVPWMVDIAAAEIDRGDVKELEVGWEVGRYLSLG